MTPKTIETAILLIEQLVEYLLEAKANGKLTDEQLDAAIASQNEGTRALIRKFIAQA